LYDMEENGDFYSVKTEFAALDFDPTVGRQNYIDVGVAFNSVFEFAPTLEDVPTEIDLLGNTKFFLEVPFYREGLQSLMPNPLSTAINVTVVEHLEEEESSDSDEEPESTLNHQHAGSTFQRRNIPRDIPFLSSAQQRSQNDSTTSATVVDESSKVPSSAPSSADTNSIESATPSLAPSIDASSFPSHAPNLSPSGTPTQLPTALVDNKSDEKHTCHLCPTEMCVVRRSGRIGQDLCLDVLMRLRKGQEISEALCTTLQQQFNENCLMTDP
jgi:hypothetical protein